MKKMSLFLMIAAILSVGIISVSGQNSAGKTYTDKNGSYSFTAPASFTTKQSDQGFALVDASNTYIIVVSSHRYNDAKAFAENANLEKDGLTLVGDVQQLGGNDFSFRTYKDTPQGRVIIDSFVLFSPHGGGVMIVAMAETDKANAAFQKALEISKTARFSKPQESQASSEWQTFLRGKHLLYLNTNNGYSARRDIYLCSNGTFASSNGDSSISINGTVATSGKGSGTWSVSGASLILNFNNGSVSEYTLSTRQASNEIGLNGNRYFVKSDAGC